MCGKKFPCKEVDDGSVTKGNNALCKVIGIENVQKNKFSGVVRTFIGSFVLKKETIVGSLDVLPRVYVHQLNKSIIMFYYDRSLTKAMTYAVWSYGWACYEWALQGFLIDKKLKFRIMWALRL